MGYREDYYEFSYHLMPHTIFNYGRLFIYRLMRNEQLFIENLKKTWSEIELDKSKLRNDPPDFTLDIVYPNVEHTEIVITIPEAAEIDEAVYIGITFDANDDFRFFTYEIGNGNHDETTYLLCEWTSSGEHFNFGSYGNRDKTLFIKEISELLVYDLL